MYRKCLCHGLKVDQETVRILLLIFDPEGVQLRRGRRLKRRQYYSRGPNWCWHIDGNDKLSPYGIAIHACIDGFSRYVVWLEANDTNRDPGVVAGYYLKAVQKRKACPVLVRGDRGTENCFVQTMQTLLRRNHADSLAGDKSFIYGQSTANQRIESWWPVLRKHCTQYWMNTFTKLKDEGQFSGDSLDKNLIAFCFLKLVQVIIYTDTNGIIMLDCSCQSSA